MNELAVRRTVKDLILNNESTLVQGLIFQGQSRYINQVTYSVITPPNGYFFITVSVTRATTSTRTGFGRTTSVPPSEVEYSVVVDISDYAVATFGEDAMYEAMDSEFQLFTDRLVALFRSSYWMTDSTGLKFRLDSERSVLKSNLSETWVEASNYHALLYTRISFTLLEECTDDTFLY
jgi:hypothetical protein